MSAAEIETGVAAPGAPTDTDETARRDLILTDVSLAQKQNIDWLSRRFAFQHQLSEYLASRGGRAIGLDLSPLDRMPTMQRWSTLLRRAALEKDGQARQRIKAALGWRLMRRPAAIVAPQTIQAPDSIAIDEDAYTAWIARYDALNEADRAAMQAAGAAGAVPALTVIVRFDAVTIGRLGAWLAALQAQLHPAWEAVLVVPAEETLRLGRAAPDPRVRFVASLDAIGPAAGWLVVAEPHVALRPETLFAFAAAGRQHAALRLVYADEDRMDGNGRRHAPLFKPQFAPELSRRMEYLGDCLFVAAETARVLPLGSRRVADWGAELAATLPASAVGRVARVLFHVVGDAPTLRKRDPGDDPRSTAPRVDIIIPTRNHAALLATCLDSIWAKTAYPADRMRAIVLDNGSDEPATLALLDRLRADPRVLVVPDPRPFNYARINNHAARAADGDVLVFLNNDTEIIQPDWLATMAGWAARPDIGVVGPKLLYPDHTVQHAGVVLGIGGVAGHSFVSIPAGEPGYMGLASVTREAAGLTGACMAVRRSVFEEIGGFDETLEIAFNDTALCCEALRRGYRNLYIGDVSLLHHESKSRGFDDTPEKVARFRHECLLVRAPYKDLFDADPYYSPNLGLERQYQPAVPRVKRVWRDGRRRINPHPRILILSDVHSVGHGVPVVIKQHAEYLAAQGCAVFVGGPLQPNEIQYAGCLRVYLEGKLEAQSFAFEADVDCVIAHTIPYFSMFRTMSDFPRRVIFDHGEPPPAFFPDDRNDRENIDAEKQFSYRLADLVLTNTATVKAEIDYAAAEVAGLGNSHLATWDGVKALERDAIRTRLGLGGKCVVLNVCRFHRAERVYKGIDDYVALKHRVEIERPDLADKIVFVLCGKGSEADRDEMAAAGLTVFANVSDAALIDLYVAADVYVNFSKWEGFNLGIAQALAMGLPVLASDIPAHRAFPIETANDEGQRVHKLEALIALPAGRERRPVLLDWAPLLEWLRDRLVRLCAVNEPERTPSTPAAFHSP